MHHYNLFQTELLMQRRWLVIVAWLHALRNDQDRKDIVCNATQNNLDLMIWERSLISVCLYSSITLLHSSMIRLCSTSLSRRSFSVCTTCMCIIIQNQDDEPLFLSTRHCSPQASHNPHKPISNNYCTGSRDLFSSVKCYIGKVTQPWTVSTLAATHFGDRTV